jgi:hypothetical protein
MFIAALLSTAGMHVCKTRYLGRNFECLARMSFHDQLKCHGGFMLADTPQNIKENTSLLKSIN